MNMQRYIVTLATSTTTSTTTPTYPELLSATGTLAQNLLLLANATASAYAYNDAANFSIAAGSTGASTDISTTEAAPVERKQRYSVREVIPLAIFAVLVSIITVVGNIMVMISFKIDKQLQTISNYFLFSLAIADFVIGAFSMPLFAYTTLLGYWPLGPHVCDLWLALDYLASNASVLNLLIISFDRYFSVTRPLTYRARRTTTRAAGMIVAAWGISLLLWPPWIYSWPYIEGKRTVPHEECYIQFIETNHYITFATAIGAFYIPVTVMVILYYQIWRETKKRQKDLPNLQAGKKDSSKRSNSSDETVAVNHTLAIALTHSDQEGGGGGWRRPRSDSSVDVDSIYTTHAMCLSRRSSTATGDTNVEHRTCVGSIKEWCIAWWHAGREYDEHYGYNINDEHSDVGYTSTSDQRDPYTLPRNSKPVSVISDISPTISSAARRPGKHHQSGGSHSRSGGGGGGSGSAIGGIVSTAYHRSQQPGSKAAASGLLPISASASSASTTAAAGGPANSGGQQRNGGGGGGMGSRSASQDSVYTIVIRLPSHAGSNGGPDEHRGVASIQMIHDDLMGTDDEFAALPPPSNRFAPSNSSSGGGGRRPLSTRDSEFSLPTVAAGGGRRMSQHAGGASGVDIRIPLNAKIIPKSLKTARQVKKKKKSQEKRQESKAARTLSAILLSFILTWTPYNILVLIKPLTNNCDNCIPQKLWDSFYALCYINSLINPVLYALCNASFRKTYIRILTCKWHTRNREAMIRNMYN